MRILHQNFLPICNLLPVVVEFLPFGMPVSQPYVAMSAPVSMPVIGGLQVSPILMSDPIGDPTPFGGAQDNRRVLFWFRV